MKKDTMNKTKCLFVVFVPLENFSIISSPLPIKGGKFRSIVGDHAYPNKNKLS